MKKSKSKFLLASMKLHSTVILKILSVTRFGDPTVYSGEFDPGLHIQEAACYPEHCSGSRLWCVTLENSANLQRSEDGNQKLAEKKILIITKLVGVFKGGQAETLYCIFFFLFKKAAWIKKTFAQLQKVLIILWPSPFKENRRGPGRLCASCFKCRLIRQGCTQRTPAPLLLLHSYTVIHISSISSPPPQHPSSISWQIQTAFTVSLGLHWYRGVTLLHT